MTRLTLAQAREHPVYQRLHELARRGAPGLTADVAEVAQLVEGLRAHDPDLHQELERLVDAPIPAVHASHVSAESLEQALRTPFPLYDIFATHLRTMPTYSCFTGVVKAARVSLHDFLPLPFLTELGTIWSTDHTFFTVDGVRRWVHEQDSSTPDIARVDLISPARKDLARFAPVCIFLCYAHASDTVPSRFVLEAGTAWGTPAELYYGPSMEAVIDHHTAYHPTPFSSKQNQYRSSLTMRDGGDEPARLVIESRQAVGYDKSGTVPAGQQGPGARPYITLTLDYVSIEEPGDVPWPGSLTIEAILRAGTIAQGLGTDGTGLGKDLVDEVSRLGQARYPWGLDPAADGDE